MWTDTGRAALVLGLLLLLPGAAPGQEATPPPVSSTPSPPPPAAAPDKDAAGALDASLTVYYQKYLGRLPPDTQAYQDHFPWWTLLFGVWPIPVLPVEGEYVAEAARERIESGRFQVLAMPPDVDLAAARLAGHLEEVALARARIEAEQEGRYNVDLKGLDIYQRHLDEVKEAGYLYHLRLTDLAVLASDDLGRFVAWSRCELTLYHVDARGRPEPLGTLSATGVGFALNVAEVLDESHRRLGGPPPTPRLDPGGYPATRALLGPRLRPVGAGATLLGGLGARGIALARATRSMLDHLDVAVSSVEGFRLEAPVSRIDGRQISFPLGTFEGLSVDRAFDVYLVAPRAADACPEALPDTPAPGLCGRWVGHARVREVADNTDPDGGRRTPEREALAAAGEGGRVVDSRPFESEAQLLVRRDPPADTLGLKVYERPLSGHGVVVLGGVGVGGGGGVGRLDGGYRRRISALVGVPELSFDTVVGLMGGADVAVSGLVGLDKRGYVGRLGLGLGGRVGVAALPGRCLECVGVGGEAYGGAELLLTPTFSLQLALSGRAFVDVDAGLATQDASALAGTSVVW